MIIWFLFSLRPQPVSRLHPGVPLGMRALGAPQSGNIRYTVVGQTFKWQQNWQQRGNRLATHLAGLVLFAGALLTRCLVDKRRGVA
jgi:hypothetical protein